MLWMPQDNRVQVAMFAKEAVKIAKAWVAELFEDENISNLGLEEVKFDEFEKQWKITLGFSRPWNTVRNAFTVVTGEQATRRSFKVVTIDDRNGDVLSVTNRKEEG